MSEIENVLLAATVWVACFLLATFVAKVLGFGGFDGGVFGVRQRPTRPPPSAPQGQGQLPAFDALNANEEPKP